MTDITALQQVASFVHALSLALTLAGICLLGILAGLSRLHWFWRMALLFVPLVMLLPIRAYEPLVLLGPLMASLALTAAWLRPRWEGNLDRPSQPKVANPKIVRPKNRFAISLGDSLLGMTLIGVVLAVLVQLPWRNLNLSWLGFCFDAGLFYLLSISCLGIVGLRRGAGWAIAMFVGIFLGIVFMSTWGDGLRALYLMGFNGPQQLEWIPLTLFFLSYVTLLTIGLWLMRWCWLAAHRPWLLAQRQRLVGSLLGIAAAPAVVLYMAMFVGPAAVPGPAIYNNSLPKLMDVAIRLDALAVGEATLNELRRDFPSGNYVSQVEAIYQESLRTVKQPGCVALDVSRQTNEDSLPEQEAQLTLLRSLARRWSREADHAFRSGDVRLATEFDLAILRLGSHLSRGGIRIHAQAATSIKSAGLSHLSILRDHVPIDLIPAVINVLEMLDAGEENPQLTNARDRYWTDIAHGWRHRLETVVQRALGLPNTETAAFHALKQPLAREAAQRRLLGTDLALRHYHQAHGEYPATLAALVPTRLALLPLDPFTHQVLIYRPLRYSFALYSTGPDAHDDGGRFSRFPGDGSQYAGQDWNLETLMRGGWRSRREFSSGQSLRPPGYAAGWTSPPWDREFRRLGDSAPGEVTVTVDDSPQGRGTQETAYRASPTSDESSRSSADDDSANGRRTFGRPFDGSWRGRRFAR